MPTFVYGKNLKVLRRKKDGMALNVSYTPEGLIWTSNKLGRALFYRRAFVSQGRIVGDLRASDDVYVERFKPVVTVGMPKDFAEAERTWLAKALRL